MRRVVKVFRVVDRPGGELKGMPLEIVPVLAHHDQLALSGHRDNQDARGCIDIEPVELEAVGHHQDFADESFGLVQEQLAFEQPRVRHAGHPYSLALFQASSKWAAYRANIAAPLSEVSSNVGDLLIVKKRK